MKEQKEFKETEFKYLMLNRSFYLYKLKYPTTFTLPDLSVKFAMDRVRQNVGLFKKINKWIYLLNRKIEE